MSYAFHDPDQIQQLISLHVQSVAPVKPDTGFVQEPWEEFENA